MKVTRKLSRRVKKIPPLRCSRVMIGRRRRAGEKRVRRVMTGQRIEGRAMAIDVLVIEDRAMVNGVLVIEDRETMIAALVIGVELRTAGRVRVDRQIVGHRLGVGLVVVDLVAVDSVVVAATVAHVPLAGQCRGSHRRVSRWHFPRIMNKAQARWMNALLVWNTSWTRC